MAQPPAKTPRLRVRFSRGQEIKFISHLDIMRLWQRALNRAVIPLAYSEGYTPHPRMSLAVPLAVGVTSEVELMDIVLSRWISPSSFTTLINSQLPPGIKVLQVFQVPLSMPSLQSKVRLAEYEVSLETTRDKEEIDAVISSLLSSEHLPWQHSRDTGVRQYDLRALIDDVWLIEWRSRYCKLGMSLRCDSSGSGRPEQVAVALGFKKYPESIHRTRLVFAAN